VRRIVVASIVLSVIGSALVACRRAPQREWPIWTGGDIYYNLESPPAPGPR
jgi:hypothetical protein